jgi:hypothetical protein
MQTTLQGDVPNVARVQAQNAINRALGKIYDDRTWSFQTAQAGWLAGWVLLNTGTYTVTPFSNQVVADVVATQQVYSLTGRPLITELQYRDPNRFFYSIVALGGNGSIAYGTTLTPGSGQTPGTYTYSILDNGGPGSGGSVSVTVASNGTVSASPVILAAGTRYVNPYINFSQGGTPATFTFTQFAVLTLDRPWMEPTSGPGQSYMIYQALFPSPCEDFRGFTAAWNTTDAWPLDFSNKSQLDLAREDPQRLIFDDPRYIVKYGPDTRPNSSTFGYQLYELWPNVLNPIPVSFGYERRGPKLVNPTDCVVYPLTEELVLWRSKEELYDMAEATKSKDMARGQGANFEYLSGKAHAQYEEILTKITAVDANLRTDLIVQTGVPGATGAPYSTRTGGVNLGGYPYGE